MLLDTVLFKSDPISKLQIPEVTNLCEESFRISICFSTFIPSFPVIDKTILRIQVLLNFRPAQRQIQTFPLDESLGFMFSWFIQEAVTKAEGLLHLHQAYQRNLKAFEVWLEKEQEKLDDLSHLDGDAQKQEATLRDLQVHNV